MISRIKKIIIWADIDRATLFSVSARVWSVIAGPITFAIIGLGFTKDEQGYYMSFLSVVGYTVFVQFGLGRVIIQFSSHEWAHVGFDKNGGVVGDADAKSKLSSLARFAIKWFVIGGFFSAIALSVGGYLFFTFSKQPATPLAWQAPWLALCLLVGIDFLFYPLYYLLEGCGKTSFVYQFNFWRGLLGNFTIWTAIYLGAGLWTYPIFFLVNLPVILFFVVYKHRNFFVSLLFNEKSSKVFNWFQEILPMQWQTTIISICSYFMFQMFTQSSMYARGPARAGQTGMTWSMILMLGLLMSAFIAPKMPKFGMLIAHKKYKEFDNLFFKAYSIGAGTLIAGAISMIIGVFVLNTVPIKLFNYYSQRILPLLPTTIFLLAFFLWNLMVQLGLYLIAHKKMPHWWIIASATCFASISTWYFGGKYGLTGAGIGLIVVYIIHCPIMFFLWRRCRLEWHYKE